VDEDQRQQLGDGYFGIDFHQAIAKLRLPQAQDVRKALT